MTRSLIIFFFIALSISIFAQNVNEQRYKLAESFENSGKINDAERIYIDLFEQEPNAIHLKAIKRVFFKQNKFSELIPYYDKYLAINKDWDIVSDYAILQWKIGKYKESKETWNESIELAGENIGALEDIANKQISERMFDLAIETYNRIRSIYGDPNIYANNLSQLYTAVDDFENATKEIFKIFENERNLGVVQGRLSALMTNEVATSYIKQVIESKLSDDKINLPLQQVYAWFLKKNGDYEKSLDVYKFIDERSNGKGRFLIQFANDARAEGEYDIALKALDHIISTEEMRAYKGSALYSYARTLESKFNIEEVLTEDEVEKLIERYEKIESENPKSSLAMNSKYRIASLSLEYLNDIERAKEELRDITTKFYRYRESVKPAIFLGDIYLMENDIAQAKSIYQNVIKRYSNSSPNEVKLADFRLAEIQYFNGNIDSAKTLFDELAKSSNNDVSNDALKRSILIENNKDYPSGLVKYAQAEFYLFSKDTNNAIELFEEASKKSIGSEIAQLSFIRKAEIKFENKEYDEVLNAINKMFELYPKSIYKEKGILLKAQYYEAKENIEKAIDYYTMLIIDHPRSIYINEARAKIRELRSSTGS